jgi:hypothetical protein
MCCHPGCVVPFIKNMLRGFSIIVKALEFSEWQVSIGFILKSLATLSIRNRVNLSLEVLKPVIDFAVVMKALDASSSDGGLFYLH